MQQQQQQPRFTSGGGGGNPHILISDASSLYSVEELPDDLSWSLRRPSTQSVGAVIMGVSHRRKLRKSAGIRAPEIRLRR